MHSCWPYPKSQRVLCELTRGYAQSLLEAEYRCSTDEGHLHFWSLFCSMQSSLTCLVVQLIDVLLCEGRIVQSDSHETANPAGGVGRNV